LSFWQALSDQDDEDEDDIEDEKMDGETQKGLIPKDPPKEHVVEDFKPIMPRLYVVGLGMGYLELPQVGLFCWHCNFF